MAMREVPYDPSRRALYKPQLGPTMFVPGRAVSTALLAAECSRLAYKKFERRGEDADEIAQALAGVGFAQPAFFNAGGTDAFAAAHASSAEVVVAFRGTEQDPRDFATDLDTRKNAWPGGGMVHRGFAAAFDRVWPALSTWLADHPAPALIAGHSLGGALATLAASRARAARLITFGCPRVGDAAFLATLVGTDVTRFVDCCDLVCRVPPVQFGFAHPETVSYIDRDGRAHARVRSFEVAEDQHRGRRDYILRHAWKVLRNVLVRDLADHAPINYVYPLVAADNGD